MNNFASYSELGVSVFVNGKLHVASPESHTNFDQIVSACQNLEWDRVETLLDVGRVIQSWSKNMEIRDGHVYFRNEPLTPGTSQKILRMINAGHPAESLEAFLVKLHENPSYAARAELLQFCDANRFLIHTDGDIMAFKSVRNDYRDKYTGKIDNSVGQVIEMERGKVDDERTRTCSRGLHFAALDYAANVYGNIREGGDRLMLIKVHPRDVVSIPIDYNNQKGRCCRYEVAAELDRDTATRFATQKEVISRRDYDESFDDDFDDDEFERCFCDCGEEIGEWDDLCCGCEEKEWER